MYLLGRHERCYFLISMKASYTFVLLLSLSATAWVFSSRLGPVEPERVAKEFRPLENPSLPAEPTPVVVLPQTVTAPVAIAEPKQPVQSLEERGDAMLFEIEALAGMPFDQAITMPFD